MQRIRVLLEGGAGDDAAGQVGFVQRVGEADWAGHGVFVGSKKGSGACLCVKCLIVRRVVAALYPLLFFTGLYSYLCTGNKSLHLLLILPHDHRFVVFDTSFFC